MQLPAFQVSFVIISSPSSSLCFGVDPTAVSFGGVGRCLRCRLHLLIVMSVSLGFWFSMTFTGTFWTFLFSSCAGLFHHFTFCVHVVSQLHGVLCGPSGGLTYLVCILFQIVLLCRSAYPLDGWCYSVAVCHPFPSCRGCYVCPWYLDPYLVFLFCLVERWLFPVMTGLTSWTCTVVVGSWHYVLLVGAVRWLSVVPCTGASVLPPSSGRYG